MTSSTNLLRSITQSIVSAQILLALKLNGSQRYVHRLFRYIEPEESCCTPIIQKELPYSLISDPKRILITALGAGEGGKTKRSHFIFEKGGKLLEKKIPVKPGDRYDLPSLKLNPLTRLFSPNLALEFIKSTTASS